MSYPERQRFETVEEQAPKLRIVVKQNGSSNGVAKKSSISRKRLNRVELAVLGWGPRSKRLAVK